MITNQVVTRVYSTMEEVTITEKFYIYKKTDLEKIRPDEEIVVCNTCHSIYKKMDKYIKH